MVNANHFFITTFNGRLVGRAVPHYCLTVSKPTYFGLTFLRHAVNPSMEAPLSHPCERGSKEGKAKPCLLEFVAATY